MLALSTSWISKQTPSGSALINTLKTLEVAAVELDYRISNAIYRQIRGLLPGSDIKVASVHNYFPIPPNLTASKGGGDLYVLSSPDREERQRAVHWTTKTIEYAGELSAAAVVLHCGYVEMEMELDRLYRFYNSSRLQSQEAKDFIARKLLEREQIKPIYLDSLLNALEQLIPVAEKHGVKLGLENRYHYRELPTLEDFEIIFNRFDGGPLGYWHDTGHAHVNESLTLIPAESLLRSHGHQLIGIHLHDARGLDDHLVPGTGDIDFQNIKNYIRKDTINVLELKPGTSGSEVSEAVRFAIDVLQE